MTNLFSRSYQTADPKQYCERCVFGTGVHANYCTVWLASLSFAALTGLERPARNIQLKP